MKKSTLKLLQKIIESEGLDCVILTRTRDNFIDTHLVGSNEIDRFQRAIKARQMFDNVVPEIMQISAN